MFPIQKCRFCCLTSSINSLTTSKLRPHEKSLLKLAEIADGNLPIATQYIYSNVASQSKRHEYQVNSLESDNHARKSSNHDEIIALFKRIQMSILGESPVVPTRKSLKKSKQKKSNKSALENLQKQGKMKAAKEKGIEEQTEEYSANASLEMQQLNKMKLAELKVLARTQGIKGYSKLKKAELLELLREV